MKSSIIIATMLALTGCAGAAPKLAPAIRVEVPVLVPCRTQSVEVPAFATDGLKTTDALEVKVRALLAERQQRMGYEILLLAAAKACQ